MSDEEPSRTPELEEIIRAGAAFALSNVFTSIPGVVIKYDKAKRRADVQPLVKRPRTLEDGTRTADSYPVVPSCPVQFPGGGGVLVRFPIKPGDIGIILFSMASLDRWLSGKGGTVDPEFDHRHHISDGIFVPGIRTFGDPGEPPPGDDEMFIGVEGEDFQGAALGATLKDFLDDFRAAIVAHTHPYLNVATPAVTGPSGFSAPTLPLVPDVESNSVKITE